MLASYPHIFPLLWRR